MPRQALLFTFMLTACVARHEGTADAHRWLKTFYPEAKQIIVQCQEYDTDGNHYASCTGRVDDKMVAIECPVRDPVGCVYNTECRLAKSTFVTE